MHVLRDELKDIQVTVSSDYSPDLAEALVRGRLDVAFMRVSRPSTWLRGDGSRAADRPDAERPSPHRAQGSESAGFRRRDLHLRFEQGRRAARRYRGVPAPLGVDIKLDHGVDNLAMAMSLVASTRGLALMPAYAKNLLPRSVVSRPLEGKRRRSIWRSATARRIAPRSSSCFFPGSSCGRRSRIRTGFRRRLGSSRL